jgi:cytochrome c oxidase cbb3-type subunit III
MPAFPKANVADIAAFLHARAQAALHSSHVPGDYPLAKLLTGDAAAGKAYFSTKCSACHSPTGDLKGVAKKYSPIDLQSRFLYPEGRGDPPRATAVITLPGGERIAGRVAHIDEFTIAVTGADGWYRSFDRTRVRTELSDPLTGHRELLHKYTDKDVHDLFAYLETLQ